MTGNREAILARARVLFNELGLESVGVRELARDLALSPGNVSYHFPRKQDLVEALMAEHGARNAALIEDLARAPHLADLLESYRRIFEGQYEYRFLLRSIVQQVELDPEIDARYAATDAERRRALARVFTAMVGGDLRADTSTEAIDRIVGTCTLVARFWVSEMRLSFRAAPVARVIDHYLAIIAHAVSPVATGAARRSLAPYLEGVLGPGGGGAAER